MGSSAKRLKEIETIQDQDIDYSEIPEADEGFWERVELEVPQPKKGIYIRLDTDIIDWPKSKGRGYQIQMNAMLRELMSSEQEQRGRCGRP